MIYLQAGKSYKVQITYHAFGGDASLCLEWTLPKSVAKQREDLAQLKSAVNGADAIIFVGGWGHGLDTEGTDRQNMDFPKGQEELIQEIAKLNRNLIVVLVHGSPFTVNGWINSAPAVLDAFYPGMEGGTAIAEALFGDVNPSGKLSFTWPKQLSDTPSHALGTEDHDNVNYKEGLLVGYRYATANGVEPQFPFGFGLSYTQFKLSDMQVSRRVNSLDAMVSLKVANTGKRAGTEIVQVYLGFPSIAEGNEPPLQLKAFERVTLQPNESKRVELKLDTRAFSYWSTKKHDWTIEKGTYQLMAGDSSDNLPLRTAVTIQ
jgi:beta-glucosidase